MSKPMASFICAEEQRQNAQVSVFCEPVKNKEIKLENGGCSYPVEHFCPTLHGDALEDCEHGKENVVKVCDPAIGTLPLPPALRSILQTETPDAGESTRTRVVLCHETWSRKYPSDSQGLSYKHGKCVSSS